MAGTNKTKTVPFRILCYLLYGNQPWIDVLNTDGLLRVRTGPAARAIRVKCSDFWEYLYWLETAKLVVSISKEAKHGTVLIQLAKSNRFK